VDAALSLGDKKRIELICPQGFLFSLLDAQRHMTGLPQLSVQPAPGIMGSQFILCLSESV